MKVENFIHKKPFVIAGPCSAESETQMLKTAENIQQNIDVFRAGVWKPRTKPNSFEVLDHILILVSSPGGPSGGKKWASWPKNDQIFLFLRFGTVYFQNFLL